VAYIGSQISEFRRRLVAVLLEPHTNNLTAPSVVNNEAYVSAFCRDERLAMAEASRDGKTIAKHDAQPIPLVYRMADFCPCPRGDANSDSRMYDAIRAGCIPVLFTSMRMHAFEGLVRPTHALPRPRLPAWRDAHPPCHCDCRPVCRAPLTHLVSTHARAFAREWCRLTTKP
jgi:hypothetical protein